jgi:sec-independent protein translocase protein TatA
MNLEKILIITLIIVLVVMGPSQLPKLAKTFGKGVKSLRDGMEGVDDEDEDETPKPKKKKPAPKPEEDDEDEAPKPKKKAKPADDEDE